MAMLNPQNLISVDDMKLEGAGLMVTWRLSGSFDPEPLAASWEAEGLSKDLLPKLPTEQRALGMAMKELSERRKLVRPLDKHAGWKVVGERADGDELTYDTTGLTAKLDAVGRPVFSPEDHPSAARVRALYEQYLLEVPSSEASSWLAGRLMRAVDAVSIKDTGGVYFVPPHQVPVFERMVHVIQEFTRHRVYAVPVVKAESTLEMVVDAMTDEVSQECEVLLRELSNFGERAVQSRIEKLNALMEKATRLEKSLGVKMLRARETMSDADGVLAAALLAAAPQMEVPGL